MKRLTGNKIILVKRKTPLEELVSRFNTVSQAKFYVEHLGADFSDYLNENSKYQKAVAESTAILNEIGRVHIIDRSFLPNFIFGDNDIVVAVGQDGLVANTLKYLSTQKLAGVNPEPERWDGVLLPFKVKDLRYIIPEAMAGTRPVKEITMAKAVLNDAQALYAVNDLFIGHKSHVSARYRISIGKSEEFHSSSGIIVSTGLGSTGWLKSIIAGANAITRSAVDKNAKTNTDLKFNWNADYLYFSVREPFPSKTSQANTVFGKVTRKEPLKILSQMAENGTIFSDGVESDFLSFNSGVEATIAVAEKRGHLLV
ncbi:MAG: sugar kinase [Planctomycetes bacterium]|nr:sugar kinase [Planctomycetota bacterium]